MANLITALQQKPSVSSANYVAEFWCLNYYDLLGTGRQRTVRAWAPGHDLVSEALRSLVLSSSLQSTQHGIPERCFQEIQTNLGAACILLFQSWDFPAPWSEELLFPLPGLHCFADKLGPSKPQKKALRATCTMVLTEPSFLQSPSSWSTFEFQSYAELGGESKQGWWLCESKHSLALQKLRIITSVKPFACLASWNMSL